MIHSGTTKEFGAVCLILNGYQGVSLSAFCNFFEFIIVALHLALLS